MNRVVLMGRLTRDPQVSYSNTQSGEQMCIARFTVACDRRMRRDASSDQQTADFISCVAFGRTGEFVEKYFKQGNRISLEGSIRTGSYMNKDNQRVYTTDVVAENVEFCESRSSGTANGGGDGFQRVYSGPNNNSNMSMDGFMNIADSVEDDGLPFN